MIKADVNEVIWCEFR